MNRDVRELADPWLTCFLLHAGDVLVTHHSNLRHYHCVLHLVVPETYKNQSKENSAAQVLWRGGESIWKSCQALSIANISVVLPLYPISANHSFVSHRRSAESGCSRRCPFLLTLHKELSFTPCLSLLVLAEPPSQDSRLPATQVMATLLFTMRGPAPHEYRSL